VANQDRNTRAGFIKILRYRTVIQFPSTLEVFSVFQSTLSRSLSLSLSHTHTHPPHTHPPTHTHTHIYIYIERERERERKREKAFRTRFVMWYLCVFPSFKFQITEMILNSLVHVSSIYFFCGCV